MLTTLIVIFVSYMLTDLPFVTFAGRMVSFPVPELQIIYVNEASDL